MAPPALRTSRTAALMLAALSSACSGSGGRSSAPIAADAGTQLIACRARVDRPHRFAEIALRDLRNLGQLRVADRNGPELRARLRPDGQRIVFARERTQDDPQSRELFVATIDNSAGEVRLTQNTVRDDEPVFSPDGTRVLFTSERDGTTGLWLADATTGAAPERFLPVPTGFADGEADWHGDSDRVVWSRRGPDQRHALWLVNGSGFGATVLTDGGTTTGAGNGDRDPAFAPDGASIAFARRTSPTTANLCVVDIATGDVTVLLATGGDVAMPRFTPAMDRLFFGLAEPDRGRQNLRLAELPVGGGTPTLAWPDERWLLRGIDFAPTAPATAAADAPVPLDIRDAGIDVSFASGSFGAPSQFETEDGNEFYLRTAISGDRQVAGITCRFTLPIAVPEDLLELRVRAVARTTRIDGDSVLRMSVYNPSDNRFDTAVEWTPTSTGQQSLQFRTSSLRHVSRELQFRINVIADLGPGDPADFWIDVVEVVLVPRQ